MRGWPAKQAKRVNLNRRHSRRLSERGGEDQII